MIRIRYWFAAALPPRASTRACPVRIRGCAKRSDPATAVQDLETTGASQRATGGRKRLQSGDLGHPAGHCGAQFAESGRLSDHRLCTVGRRKSRPARRGFSLGESSWSSPRTSIISFRAQLVASLTPEDTVEVEEAFFQTLSLGSGFTLKGGRFPRPRSATQNQIHQHAWDFQDASLALQGVSRRALERRWRAAEMGGAHRPADRTRH